ncbi:MAG: hypothetical protein SGBAC_006229 [Bacillariaceae sp.]
MEGPKMDSIPPLANAPKKKLDDDEKSSSSDGTVEEPTETEQRYAALRNHQIRFADAIDPNAERVYKLRKKDIIFGRGRGFQNHPGNERMRDIIEKHKTKYHSLNRDGKRKLVELVYEEITEGGARFLKKLDGESTWVVVDLPIALQKVSHTMRCRKSIIRQLDEHGNVPTTLGGPPGLPAHHGLPPTLSRMPPTLAGMHRSVVIPGMVSAGTIPGMPTSAGLLPGAMPGASPGAVAGGLPSLGASGLYPPPPAGAGDSSLAALEAQRRAALHRYRVLSGMAVARQGDIEYYQNLRREQLLRETRMLQQMGDAALLGGPTPAGAGSLMPPAADPSSLAAVPPGTALGVPGAATAAGLPSAAGARVPAYAMPTSAQVPGPTPGAIPGAIPGPIASDPLAAAPTEGALKAPMTMTLPKPAE